MFRGMLRWSRSLQITLCQSGTDIVLKRPEDRMGLAAKNPCSGGPFVLSRRESQVIATCQIQGALPTCSGKGTTSRTAAAVGIITWFKFVSLHSRSPRSIWLPHRPYCGLSGYVTDLTPTASFKPFTEASGAWISTLFPGMWYFYCVVFVGRGNFQRLLLSPSYFIGPLSMGKSAYGGILLLC